MKASTLLQAVVVCGLSSSLALMAQEKGRWRAASTTARSITGDIAFANEKLTINFSGYPIAQIRELQPEELMAAFHADSNTRGVGNLYRLSIPATQPLLHRNTLCGADETQWMITFMEGRNLQLAFFSGGQMPELTADALANTRALCGTFSYNR